MIPIRFPESNGMLTASHGRPMDQHGNEIGDLAIFRDGDILYSCWRPRLRERLSILFFGRVWLAVHSIRHPPVSLNAVRTIFEPAPPREPEIRGL